MTDFRERCLGRAQLIGTFAAIPHPVAVEVAACSGPDFLCIDWEHAQFSRDCLENLIRAADLHGVPALVRVPGHAQEAIAAALDSGAAGILVPRVSTAAEAHLAVMASRYPPEGRRGVGPGRAAAYGYRIPQYLAAANSNIVVAVQVETAEGLANSSGIAATEGIDVVFVGPGDLSVSIDAIGPAGAERLGAAIEAILGAAKAAGRTAGIFCFSPAEVARWEARGASFFILSSDTTFLGGGAAAAFAAARS